MFDDVHLHMTLPGNDPAAVQRLARSAAFAEADGQPDDRGRIRARHRGLRLYYLPDSRKLLLRGSLQTFAQGSNTGLFQAPAVVAACAELAEVLDAPAHLLAVCKLEAGLNLPVPTPPRPFLESLASHKGSPFTALKPPSGAARSLEYNAYHADYRVKFYDKGTYSRLQGHPPPPNAPPYLLRFEVVFERTRHIRNVTGLTAPTLADLPHPQVMAAFAAHLQVHWHLTQRHQSPNYDRLTLAEAALLHTAYDLDFWRTMQATQPRNTYARNRAKTKALLHERAEPHPYDAIFARELAHLTQFAPAA